MKYRRFRRAMLNGRPGDISFACKRFIVRATNAGLEVTSTTGGRHTSTSYHYPRRFLGAKGRAVDVAGPWHKMVDFQLKEAARPTRYSELLGPANRFNVKNGRRTVLGEGTPLEELHDTHVHGAPRW